MPDMLLGSRDTDGTKTDKNLSLWSYIPESYYHKINCTERIGNS